jgi:hypothetical protein
MKIKLIENRYLVWYFMLSKTTAFKLFVAFLYLPCKKRV